MSLSKENTPSKCAKISDESKKESICIMSKNEERLMGKIRLRIGEQMDLNTALFNEKLENLKRRVEQLECAKTHEDITKMLLKKVSKLERRINPVIASQKGVCSKAAVPQSEMKERKLEAIHIKEVNHDNSEDFEAISTSSSKDAFCPELAEEFTDPPQNPKTTRDCCVKSEGDCTAMTLPDNDPMCTSLCSYQLDLFH